MYCMLYNVLLRATLLHAHFHVNVKVKLSIFVCSSAGRPQIDVDFDDIELLRQLRFSWTKIAEILGISRSTLYRRLQSEGISQHLTYSNITDASLDRHIELIKLRHPHDGERLLIGHLRARGIVVPRSRLRASIHRVDPVNTELRRRVTLRRRVYFAKGPNSVWHIDGHHKLIRWRLVTHGGIDGFSRTIVYLQCSDNNRATTVLRTFMEACLIHGLPEKVRSDLGGENIEVWRYLIEQHGSESAIITGSSTHNERIERLWRDVMRCVSSIYYGVFKQLEDEGKLDPLNELDVYCLHKVYLPRINTALKSFVESWNHHPVSTEQNLSPSQLFIRGAIDQTVSITEPHNVHQSRADLLPGPNDTVSIPRIQFQPCQNLEQQLMLIDPLASTDFVSSDAYYLAINTVGTHLMHGCTTCIV